MGFAKRKTHTRVYAMSSSAKWMDAGPLRDYLEKVSAENKERARYCSFCDKPTADHWEALRGSPTLIRACKECCPEEHE